jgi:hypothetical protein
MTHRFRAAMTAAVLATTPVVIAVTPAEAVAASTWPQPGYDAGHSFYNPAESVVNAGSITSLKLRWQITPTPSDAPGYPVSSGPSWPAR